MSAQKHIKMIMTDKEIKSGTIAKDLGKEAQVFYNILYRNTMSFNMAEKIADILDCDIIFRDRKTGKEY